MNPQFQQIEECAVKFRQNLVDQDMTTRILQSQNPEMAADVSVIVSRIYEPVQTVTIENPDTNGEFSSPLAGALYMASRNIPQIPLRPRSKQAFLEGWPTLATTDYEQIKKWGADYPDCNFGSVAKRDGILIFETDSSDVRKRFAGTFSSQFLVQSSTSERGHRYYKNPGIASIAQMDNKHGDFSLRADDMYCCSPGSVHPETGKAYRFVSNGPIGEPTKEEINFWNSERKPEPELKAKPVRNEADPGFQKLFDEVGWKPLIDRLTKHPDLRFHDPVLEPGKLMYCPMPGHYKPEDADKKFTTTPFGVVDGSMLHCFGCEYSGDMVAACNILDANSSSGLVASVSMYETARIISEENGLKFEDYFPDLPKSAESSNQLRTRRGNEVTTKRITWLWDQRVPFAKLSLFAGNPDQGKSLVTMDIAARLTSGRALYGSQARPACDVLIMAGEDDSADTIIPRLQGAGADLNRIHIVDSVVTKDGKGVTINEREAQLDTDTRAIELMLNGHPEIKLVIIDPLSNYLGRANMNREQEVRQVLVPLKGLTERTGVSIIAVMHLNKNGDASAIHRVGGAVAFTGVARAAWLFTEDPEDKEKHLMLRIKGNIAKRVGGLVYRIGTVPVLVESSETNQPLIEWVGETENAASDILMGGKPAGRPDVKVKSAVEWLADFLSKGSELANDVFHFGYKAGHSKMTLRRAKDELKVESIKVVNVWEWWLPGTPKSQHHEVNLEPTEAAA